MNTTHHCQIVMLTQYSPLDGKALAHLSCQELYVRDRDCKLTRARQVVNVQLVVNNSTNIL